MQNLRLISYLLVGILFCHSLAYGSEKFYSSSLYFEPNYHQLHPDMLFLSRGNSVSVGCYNNALVLYIPKLNTYLKITFSESQSASIEGSILLPSYSSYFQKGATCPIVIPHYKAVHYKEIYPGIDLYIYEKNSNIKFDFILHPHAQLDALRIAFEVLDTSNQRWTLVKPELKGNLIYIHADNTTLELHAPYALQWVNGTSQEIPIELHYDNGLTFKINNPYNPDYPVLIDPTLIAGTYLGGNNTDKIIDVKTDTAGNIYLVGETKSINFPTTNGTFQSNFQGGEITGDVFITKLNSLANTLIFSTFLGGSGDDSPTSIQIDEQRNIYISGITSSSDFPITPHAFQTQKSGDRDAFFTKMNPDGTSLLYSTYIGGSGSESIMDFTFLPDQSIVIAGWTQSTDFPVSGNSSLNQMFSGGSLDGFLIKFNSSFQLSWSGFIGTSGIDVIKTIESYGDTIIIGGYTSSTNFPITSGSFQTIYAGGNYDAFITQLSGDNASLIASSYLGGSLIDLCNALVCDNNGNIYITGETSSNNFPVTISAFQVGYGGGERDAFITKITPDLQQIIFSTYLGGSKTETGLNINLDRYYRPYVVGYTYSGDFPVIPGTLQPSYGGNQDAYFACLNPNGSTLQYSTFYGGQGEEKARSLYISDFDILYIVGETASTLLPITSGTLQTTYGGGTLDGFLACIDISAPTTEGEGQSEGTNEGVVEGTIEGEGLRVWLVGPVERTVNEGGQTTFIIGISGYVGTVNYQWQFKSITGDEYLPIPNTNSPMLTLQNITSTSAGFYRCRVTDSQGTVFSAPFKLNVITSPEGIIEGTIEGTSEGNSEGIIEGMIEGSWEGATDGQIEGNFEGSSEGVPEGSIPEGEGIGEGSSEGEGTYYPCGFEISGTETHSLLLDMAQNLYYVYVPNEGFLNDIIVNITLTHEDLRQILIQVISPSGTEVFLLVYPTQGGNALLNTYFDDNADISINEGVSPFTGSYRPVGYLGILRGENLKGTWALRIVDSQSGGRGYLESWKLIFNTHACLEEGTSDEGETIIYHSADLNQDYTFSLPEVLRVIQIFNFGSYHCDVTGEDGYGLGPGEQNCKRHSSDYLMPYWTISLYELLRLIQLFNIGGYRVCPETEDGFCPLK